MTLLRNCIDTPLSARRADALVGDEPDIATDPSGPTYDEPIRHPRLEVDGALAMVFAEYQVRIAGNVSHCGYDAFHLVRTSDGWKILNLADTFRRERCGSAW